MTAKIIGESLKTDRLITNLFSFDRAFINQKGEIGFPLGKAAEIFGAAGTGKSTITYSLAGLIAAARGGDILLADFEGFDPDFLLAVLDNSGFDGKIQPIQKDDDEDSLDTLVSLFRKDNFKVGIVDSVGAISPISEQTGQLGEVNMGRRSFLMAQFCRKIVKLLRSNTDKTLFMTNHAYPKIGGRGLDTPGGEVKKYLASIRIQVKRKFWKGKYEEFPDGSYIIEGLVVKNRWGLKDRKFDLFVLSGKGIHLGLTALYDGLKIGAVERGKSIKLNGKNYGYLRDVIKEAQSGNEEFFIPFFDALKGASDVQMPSEDEIGESVIEESVIEEPTSDE